MARPPAKIFNRLIVFLGLEAGHRWSSERIRAKLNAEPVDFGVEAERLTLAAFGSEDQYYGDDEETRAERQMRAQSVDDHKRMLERTETYLWGLGIAGIYHQFERDVREVVTTLRQPRLAASKIQKADFSQLCLYLEDIGYQIKQSAGFNCLNTARLISNVIKHGEGAAFIELANIRSDLFPDHQEYSKLFKTCMGPGLDDMRIGIVEFDEAASAIAVIWPEMEKAVSMVFSVQYF